MAFNIQTKSCMLRLDHIICAHGFAQALNWYAYIPNTIIHSRVLNLQILSFKIYYACRCVSGEDKLYGKIQSDHLSPFLKHYYMPFNQVILL